MAADLIPIDHPDDPRVAAFTRVQERDLVGRQGLFLAEGEVVVRVLARSPLCSTDALLLADKRVPALADVIAVLPAGTPVYAAPQGVMDQVAGFSMHRGILALGRRRDPPTADDLLAALPPRALVLALAGISNHDNMGGLFRNAAAFGADAVILDADACDPLYRKAIRVSAGLALVTPFARLERGADLIDRLEAAGLAPLALSPAGEARLCDLAPPARAALVLGAEGPGLPPALLARCRTVRIPMAAGVDSLNVAVSAGIALHQLRFGPGGAG